MLVSACFSSLHELLEKLCKRRVGFAGQARFWSIENPNECLDLRSEIIGSCHKQSVQSGIAGEPIVSTIVTQFDKFHDCLSYFVHVHMAQIKNLGDGHAVIDEFWSDAELATLDPDEEASGAGGEERCATDPGFFGPYAASNPEEDFAESFSAYVFDVPTETPEQQARVDWLADQPGLVEFRERAVDADLAPIDWLFEPCG